MRIDAPLCFLNVSFLEGYFEKAFSENAPKVVVMDWSSVSLIDISGYNNMKQIFENAKERDIVVLICRLQKDVYNDLKNFGIFDVLDEEQIFFELHDAVVHGSNLIKESEKF